MDTAFLNDVYLGNPIYKWLTSAGVIGLSLLFNGLFAKLASKASYRIFRKVSQEQFYEEFSRLLNRPFLNLINLLAIYFSLSHLSFPAEWEMVTKDEFGVRWILHTAFIIACIVVIGDLFLKATSFMEHVYHNLENASISKDLASFLKELTRVLIYIACFFAVLGKAFQVDISALITGLGIGGLAIALAAQDTLANLIGSFIIYLDKPFQIGELIQLGDISGTVEKIGFRTTRIRTVEKSLLIVPNKKIIDSNLNNITQSQQRRVKFTLGLTYQTQASQILSLRDEIRQLIAEAGPLVSDDITVRFIDFDSSSLNILVVYFVNSNSYDVMAEIKEKLNLQIMALVEAHGCQFAYPTQTVFVQN